jgi:hypothetical protein
MKKTEPRLFHRMDSLMGIGLRVFLIHDDDSIIHLSVERYNRVLHRDPKELLPQYAGRRVRCAIAVLEVIDRKPKRIRELECSFLQFDSEGRLDNEEMEREARYAMDLLPPLAESEESPIVDARYLFAQRRLQQQFRWTPTPEIETAIEYSILGEDF